MAILTKSSVNNNKQATTIISLGTYIRGDLMLSSLLYVNGNVEGNIISNTSSVVIGKHGSVKGNIRAQKVIVKGKIEGNVDADEIEILEDAHFVGDIEVRDLICDRGGKFIGHCTYREHAREEVLMLNDRSQDEDYPDIIYELEDEQDEQEDKEDKQTRK